MHDLAENYQEQLKLANKGFGKILADGFRLFSKTWMKILLPLALFYVVSLLLSVLLTTDLNWQLNTLQTTANAIMDNYLTNGVAPSSAELDILINYILFSYGVTIGDLIITTPFMVVALCSVSMFLYKCFRNQNPNFKENFKQSFNKNLLWVILILGIGMPLGAIFIFIPSIIIFGLFIFTIFTYQLTEVKKPIYYGRFAAKKGFFRIIGIFIIATLIITFINFFYQPIIETFFPLNLSWYNPVSRRYDLIFAYQLLLNVVSILLSPLFICLCTSLFASQRAKVELGHYKGRPYYQQVTPTKPSLKEPESLEMNATGLYCPFCGKYMEFKLKFCPNCGESLDF
jgi:hypothetical protein